MTKEYCECCGASLKKYWHKLTPGLVKGLAKFYAVVVSKGENSVHLLKDMDGSFKLTPHEWNNWTKLRFHGLVARVDKDSHSGYWLLTRRGADFLKGNIAVPSKVQTFRNKVVAHDIKKVFLKDVVGTNPYFEQYEHYRNQLEFMVFPENKKPEANLPIIPSMRSRGKKISCSCGGRIIRKITPIGESENGNMIVETRLVCNLCRFDFGEP